MEKVFYFYQNIKLYSLSSRKVTGKKAEAINQEMRFVMTGDPSHIKKRES